MKLELILSMIALLLSFSSVTFGVIYTLKQVRNTSILASNAALIQVEKFLGDVPSALRFHGIEVEDLQNAGITAQEFVTYSQVVLVVLFITGPVFIEPMMGPLRRGVIDTSCAFSLQLERLGLLFES